MTPTDFYFRSMMFLGVLIVVWERFGLIPAGIIGFVSIAAFITLECVVGYREWQYQLAEKRRLLERSARRNMNRVRRADGRHEVPLESGISE